MSNDFLRLLMFGVASDELQNFLLHDLSEKVRHDVTAWLVMSFRSFLCMYDLAEKVHMRHDVTMTLPVTQLCWTDTRNLYCTQGLKKLGHSIESSYSNIQKLVLKHLQAVAQALAYHLNDVRGMAELRDRFADLGLGVDACACAVNMAASFLLKSSELQQ